MLLIHQVGSVKIGEVVRYHVTYTPSRDRILPSPENLYVRIRNTSAIALRAAFVHGPYTLSVAAWPSNFDPNEKYTEAERYGVPEFEPMVKASGSWECELTVPEHIRQSAGIGSHGGFGESPEHDNESASWVIEVSSQVIFSTSAAVGYEVLVARDKKSLNLGLSLPIVGNQSQVPQPGRVTDHQQSLGSKDGHHPAQPKGVFSRAVKLDVEDTASLWNTPRLPGWDDAGADRAKHEKGGDKPVESVVHTGDAKASQGNTTKESRPRKQKKIHLVVLTHGLHSNLGADMLFMKESIDSAAKQARLDRKARRAKERAQRGRSGFQKASAETTEDPSGTDAVGTDDTAEAPSTGVADGGGPSADESKATTSAETDSDDEDDDEEVIVRGFSGNATKTERGIKYLGKRLARYVLSMTYPDQPYIPMGKEALEARAHAHVHTHTDPADKNNMSSSHKHSTIRSDASQEAPAGKHQRPYKVTSISFIGHSLGGLVQTYAVAYIQKHSPEFFDLITPINFIGLATPWLGLSNENPVYVKFALDFGLVGRSGKDLGLTWRAPTIARSGWGAIVGNLGDAAHKKVYGDVQPESKPLLRILPTGPAHRALRKFRNRTIYSNVVNDGIVPLRTSCLLFLDWHGLGRVDKARRDAGLVETMVGFGWAELTGANLGNSKGKQYLAAKDQTASGDTTPKGNLTQVPQPAEDAVVEDDRRSIENATTPYSENASMDPTDMIANGPLAGFFNYFKNKDAPKPHTTSPKQKKIFNSSQTRPTDEHACTGSDDASGSERRPKATSGQEMEDPDNVNAPPRTTFFEAAGDLLNPKMPDVEYLIDPSKRPRTIFHDRVYHPTDIPSPPLKKRTPTLTRRALNRASSSSQISTNSHKSQSSVSTSPSSSAPKPKGAQSDATKDSLGGSSQDGQESGEDVVDSSNMRVEEKIARAYHRDLPWRKVLVKLEPDAHNNIIVRRMFVNAYGWPVVKHLVDAHFSDLAVARGRDDDEFIGERALDMNQPPDEHGGETKQVPSGRVVAHRLTASPELRTASESREATDKVPDLPNLDTEQPGQNPANAASSDTSSPPKVRRGIDRYDSAQWSEGDFRDSEPDSDDEGSSFGPEASALGMSPTQVMKRKDEEADKKKRETQGHERTTSREWNWTEKIVGRREGSKK